MTRTRSFETPDDLGGAAAKVIAQGIADAAGEGRPYLLGCPGGRTPKPIYEALGRLSAEHSIDCSQVVIVMMDEYLEPGVTPPVTVPATTHNSCRRFAEHDIRQVINQGLPAEKAIRPESVWLPDPAEPTAYDQKISQAGGIDLFIVASGASDGHVAFCGPGSAIDGVTSIVTLAETTRTDNLKTFPDFASVDDVPTHGISVGLGTIRNHSRSVLLVLHGPDKRESARRVQTSVDYDPSWPATFIHQCPNAEIWVDSAAKWDA